MQCAARLYSQERSKSYTRDETSPSKVPPPDLPTLQALVAGSPSYLRAYRSQRHSILSSILLRDIYPDVLFDVLAIVDALKLPRNYDDYVPQLKAFIEQYKTMRASLYMALEPLEPSTKRPNGTFTCRLLMSQMTFVITRCQRTRSQAKV